jgi:ribosome-associated protein
MEETKTTNSAEPAGVQTEGRFPRPDHGPHAADFQERTLMTELNPNLTNASKTPTRPRATTHEPQDVVAPVAVARRDAERLARALERARHCCRIAADNRAKDLLLLDVRDQTPLIDYFVIASVVSRRQAQSTASEIDAEMKKLGEFKLGMEGYEEGRWVLIDYGDFVVHILSEDARQYYGLEEIWGDAERLDWQTGERIEDEQRGRDH